MALDPALEAFREYPIEPGFAYPEQIISIDVAEQRRLHGYCDIEPGLFGNTADPSLVSRLPIVMLSNTIVVQRPRWGQVHTVQRIEQRRPVATGEALNLYGTIDRCAPHPRGEIMKSTWRYIDACNKTVLVVRPDVLMIDPDGGSATAKKPGVAEAGAESSLLWSKTCTPEKTVGYCEGTFNPIHDNPKVANSFGFRAPIIAGTQTMSFLLEPIYRRAAVDTLDVTIQFRRPVFWDDVLGIEAVENPQGYSYIRASNADGKVVADCTIER